MDRTLALDKSDHLRDRIRRPSRTFPHARRPASENLQGTKPRGGARSGAVPRAQLWGFESQARSQREAILNGRWPRMRAQLKRYGMDIAKWGFEVSGHMRFQRVRRGKNITCHNFRVVRFATMEQAEAMSLKDCSFELVPYFR